MKNKDITYFNATTKERLEMHQNLLKQLIPIMNNIHNTSYSDRFWKILLDDYISSILKKHNVYSNKIIEEKLRPKISSYMNDSFPEKLFWVKIIKKIINFILNPFPSFYIKKIIKDKTNLTIGMPQIKETSELGFPLKIIEYILLKRGNICKNIKLYNMIKECDSPLLINTIYNLPKIFIEYFSNTLEKIPLIDPQNKTFHIHNNRNIYDLFLLAKYSESGSKIIWYQHGAYFGEFKNHNSHFHQSYNSDKFRTWGWKINDKDEPWKAYRLERFKQEYSRNNYFNYQYDLLLCFTVIDNSNINTTKDVVSNLLQKLDRKCYKKILARPRPNNKLFSHVKVLNFISDKHVIKETGKENISNSVSKCKIVLQMNIPSTNFLECIYVDHPTVGLLDNNEPTDIVKPYYDFFLENGVLHRNVNSLILHLNKIELSIWWSKIINNKIYKDFKTLFANRV